MKFFLVAVSLFPPLISYATLYFGLNFIYKHINLQAQLTVATHSGCRYKVPSPSNTLVSHFRYTAHLFQRNLPTTSWIHQAALRETCFLGSVWTVRISSYKTHLKRKSEQEKIQRKGWPKNEPANTGLSNYRLSCGSQFGVSLEILSLPCKTGREWM